MRKIIDFHAHIFPDKIAEKAAMNIGKFYDNREMRWQGYLSQLIESGENAGIEKFVVQSVATTPGQVCSINNFISSEAKKSGGKVIGLAALHPDFEDLDAEIERIFELGLKGVKLHPDFQQFNIDDEKAMPIYEKIAGRLPLLIHMGDFRTDYSHPRRLANVLDTFPKLDVVAAHFGGWSVWDDAEKHLLSRRCWVDTSSTFQFISDMQTCRQMANKWGADRIIFGTDYPMADCGDELELFLDVMRDYSEEDIDKMLHLNAKNLLKI